MWLRASIYCRKRKTPPVTFPGICRNNNNENFRCGEADEWGKYQKKTKKKTAHEFRKISFHQFRLAPTPPTFPTYLISFCLLRKRCGSSWKIGFVVSKTMQALFLQKTFSCEAMRWWKFFGIRIGNSSRVVPTTTYCFILCTRNKI